MSTAPPPVNTIYNATYEVSRVKTGTPYGFKVNMYLSNAISLKITNVYVYDSNTSQIKTEIPLGQCTFNKIAGNFTIRMIGKANFGLIYLLKTNVQGKTKNITIRPKNINLYLSNI